MMNTINPSDWKLILRVLVRIISVIVTIVAAIGCTIAAW